jgi:hypothetical protein
VFHGVVVIIEIGNWGWYFGKPVFSSTREHQVTVFGQLPCFYLISSSSNGNLLSS